MPNRVLKDWTASEKVDQLSVGAEVFFTRLIMKADDFGNYVANTKLLKSTLFPLKEYTLVEVGSWVSECTKLGLIKIYSIDDRDYLHIFDFDQKLRRMKNTYPPPPDGETRTSDGQVTDKRGQKTAETKRNETESRNETEREVTLSEFEKLFDDLWLEQIAIVHKGKDIKQTIKEAYLHLQTENRLWRGEISDFKKCVQAFLSNKKADQFNGKSKAERIAAENKRKLDNA